MSNSKFGSKWLSILGVGEEGLAALSPGGRLLLSQANLVVGGKRHLAMLPPEDPRPTLAWTSPIATTVAQILARRGEKVAILASGDPMCYGIGVTLSRQLPLSEMIILPTASAFSLACARLGWALAEVETLSLCGRDPALLNRLLYPGAKILALSANKSTVAKVACCLREQGYGDSQITVLERMGGSQERISTAPAARWTSPEDLADLNTLALAIPPDLHPHCRATRTSGLPDLAYRHDGQLTKQEVRAITLAALNPLPGQLLWDVGAGCGSIGIEWLRCDRRSRAIAIEQQPSRQQYIAENAINLGVPHLEIIAGTAPLALHNLPEPDAIFIGGGLTKPDLLETCWKSLRIGGRLVANAVTVESEQLLLQWQAQVGGTLTRISIQRATPVGQFLGWKAMAPVTQWVVGKETELGHKKGHPIA
ncbi:MAG: precorrin-6y C5,15-methyltransferase (decarboxylating) subunit CbiE [Acaryochloridaceae cyanobacterium SU_2_1]|nr:precorrin-6y C5,15-methyltransferase (decarboxylating) subunit CbiE [Acaryochloridaceae cyanobacterium SU_2_1]